MDNILNIKNLLNSDHEAFKPNEIIFYPFCGNDAKMIQRIRNHTVTSNFFIFCDSFKRPGKDEVNTERSMDNAIEKCGYLTVSADKYYLDDLLDLKSFESSLKKRYGTNYTTHLADRKYRTRPFLTRYIIYRPIDRGFLNAIKTKSEILALNKPNYIYLYYAVYEPLSFLELLSDLKGKIGSKLTFAMILKDYDYWFGAADLLQPNRRLMKTLDPSFIVGPKKYWHSDENGAIFFKNWKKGYAKPVILDKDLVISHKKDISSDKEELFMNLRVIKNAGLIDG